MWGTILALLRRYWKPIAVILLVLLALGGSYLKGSADKDQEWQARWKQRDLDDSTQKGIDNVAARIIEQGRAIERQEAIEDAQKREVAALAAADRLRGTVDGLQQLAARYAAQLDAARATNDLAATVQRKTAGAGSTLLANMLASVAREAEYYAKRSDQSYNAGLTCERLYESVRTTQEKVKGP